MPDGKGGYRPSSGAFKPGRDGTISVDLEEALYWDGLTADSRFPSLRQAVGLVAHKVGFYRDLGNDVELAVVDGNDYHGSVIHSAPSNAALRACARELAELYEAVIEIDVDEAARFIALHQSKG
jgi:hypothetical protein